MYDKFKNLFIGDPKYIHKKVEADVIEGEDAGLEGE
jgi:hypothetical protein